MVKMQKVSKKSSAELYNEVLYWATQGKLWEQIKTGSGLPLFDGAIRDIGEIEELYWKIESLLSVYLALYDFDPKTAQEALKNVILHSKNLTDPCQRSKLLASTSLAIFQKNGKDSVELADEAITLAERISDPFYKELAVLNVVKTIAPVIPKKAMEAFEKVSSFNHPQNQFAKDTALCSLVKEFAKRDPIKIGLHLVSLIKDAYIKDEALAEVIEHVLFLNREKCLSLLTDLKDPILKAKTYHKITSELFVYDASLAFELTPKIKDPYWTVLTLLNFASRPIKDLAKVAFMLEGASKHIKERLGDFFSKAKCLVALSVITSKIDMENAIGLAREALSNANRIEDPFAKTIALLDVSSAYFFLDLDDELDLNKSIQSIDDESMRNQVNLLHTSLLVSRKKMVSETEELSKKWKDGLLTDEEFAKQYDECRLQRTLESLSDWTKTSHKTVQNRSAPKTTNK